MQKPKEREVTRCLGCPFQADTHHRDDIKRGHWFWCRVGGTLQNATPLIKIKRPSDCPLPITVKIKDSE